MTTGSAELRNARILIVDDTPQNIDVLRKFLALEGYKLSFATSGAKALQIVSRALPDLILLDVMMPEMDGFEVCRHLKAEKHTREVPVIFLTALTDTKDKLKGFELGAVDYITKPLQYEEVLARVATHIRLQATTNELRRRTEESEQARHEAELANRAKNTFLANMSHELRTPLNAILGYTDLIQDEASDLGYQDIIPDLTRIQSAAKNLLHIISEVLDVAKLEAEKVEMECTEVIVMPLVQQVIDSFKSSFAQTENQFTLQCSEDLDGLKVDPGKLQQIIYNLIDNANKYTSHGHITLRLHKEAQGLCFEIEDTGIGIAEEHLDTIFNPFSQADNSYSRPYEGTGLGLTISKAFAEMMGGRISVQSTPGEGSVFTLWLPA